jgi:hypothetical protein
VREEARMVGGFLDIFESLVADDWDESKSARSLELGGGDGGYKESRPEKDSVEFHEAAHCFSLFGF